MTKEWDSKPLTQLIKEPWVGRNSITQDWGSARDKWLASKKGTIVAASERFSFAYSLIEGMKRVNPYLRVAIVVPTLALQEQWYEEINKTFDFSQGLVGLLGGGHQDTFSARTRILICIVDASSPVIVDPFLRRDLFLIVDDASHFEDGALEYIYEVPRSYSLGLITGILEEDYNSSRMGKELGSVIFSQSPPYIKDIQQAESTTSKSMKYLDCNSIRTSDEYIHGLLSEGMLIGDIQVNETGLDHLSSLITSELKKTVPNMKNSLSVAVFLVWMGILHYQEGNYWTPVYDALGFPQSQVKWQSVLGDSFLGAIRKYNLLAVQDKLTYISPILAHGYVPNHYLGSYFEDGIFAIYKARDKGNLSISKDEVVQLVSNWREDYKEYQAVHAKLEQLEKKEKQLVLFQETLLNKETLLRYRGFLRTKNESEEVSCLLAYPENWLVKAEEDKQQLQLRYNELCILLEQEQHFLESREALSAEIKELECLADATAKGTLLNWDCKFSDSVLNIPQEEVKKLVQDYSSYRYVFHGLLGKVFRIFFPKRLRRGLAVEEQLKEVLGPLEISQHVLGAKTGMNQLLEMVTELQRILGRRREIVKTIEEQERASTEIAVGSSLVEENSDLKVLKERLDGISQDLVEYKMNVVKLGRGRFEDGVAILAEQRVINREISAIRSSIKSDLDTMLACLPSVIKYNENELYSSLVRIRKQIKECNDKLKIHTNPLYMLIESTRAFILQGGDKAVDFLHDSLLLMQYLDKGIDAGEIQLPVRISRAMEEWWQSSGQTKIKDFRTERVVSRGRGREGTSLRKPWIYLDTMDREIRIQLPSQLVGKGRARFNIQDSSGESQSYIVPMRRVEGGYHTEKLAIPLQAPERIYNIEFMCGNIFREWQIHGPGWDNFCMLLNSSMQKLEGNRLPDEEAWIIAPSAFSIEPAGNIREQFSLHGGWSDFVCTNIDLDDVDVVLVRSGQNVDLFKRQAQLEPTLLGGEMVAGVTSRDGAPIYRRGLPGLAFSVHDPGEIRYYGIHAGEARYKPVSDLKPVISKDNAVFVDLRELLDDTYGEIKLTLTYRGTKIIWSGMCAVVPDLQISFNRNIYLPVEDNPENGRSTVISEVPLCIALEPPGKVNGSTESKSIIEFDTLCVESSLMCRPI